MIQKTYAAYVEPHTHTHTHTLTHTHTHSHTNKQTNKQTSWWKNSRSFVSNHPGDCCCQPPLDVTRTVNEDRDCNSCATCIWHTISHGTTHPSVHLTPGTRNSIRKGADSSLCKCNHYEYARISCTRYKWILGWVVPCKIMWQMHVTQLLTETLR
jgi:hypothetical protein